MNTILEVKNLEKTFGSQKVFSGLNFFLEKNKITVLFGESGIGKTTLLKCLLLLEQPEDGEIKIEDTKFFEKGVIINEQIIRNKIGMVFQDFYLWDNKKVLDNIIEALIFVKKIKKAKAITIAGKIIKKLHLASELLEKYPPELSRGQRQRVAIARTLAMDTDLIILDEPTASLDEMLVEQIMEIVKTLRDNGKTILIVTHDLVFAKNIGDIIINFNDLIGS
jgi:ABC-type polar amino acid transport system ATPase subunit